MTDLMKRYEAETGKNVYRPSYTQWLETKVEAEKRCYQQLSEMYIVVSRAEAYQRKEAEKLKAQLRWRPVSEKPEKDGEYFAKHDTSDEPSVLSYKDGVWLFFDYDIAENVITNPPLYWLPIPPAPEGNHP